MNEIKTKNDVFNSICNASFLDTLGLFVGAGFTKAIMERSGGKAYKWGELLEACCDKLGIEKTIMKDFGSYPEIATKICKRYSEHHSCAFQDAVNKLKEIICQLTTISPTDGVQSEYEDIFNRLGINWVATTNYDTIIESLLNGKALSIEPSGCFTKIKDLVPVYHIHGICRNPSSIIITNEDYAYVFRPNDYRQARLPFLIKESLVLMVGYGLGDINVLTAVDWSKNVYTNSSEEYNFPIIQLLYVDNPKTEPYQDESGIIIFEINDIHSFFFELRQYADKSIDKLKKRSEKVNNYIYEFSNSSTDIIDLYANNKRLYRTNTNTFIASLPREFGYIYTSFMTLLRNVITFLNESSKKYGAFSAYDKKLNIILDAFCCIPLAHMPKPFFELLTKELNDVWNYVGNEMGQSWRAAQTWGKRKKELPSDIIDELWRIVKSSNYSMNNLYKLLSELKEEDENA